MATDTPETLADIAGRGTAPAAQPAMDEESRKVLSALQSLCARQECCSSDMYHKAVRRLMASDIPAPGTAASRAERVVGALVAEGYIDDLRYASAFARDKASITGWGEIKIRQALRAKNIGDELISKALQTIETGRAEEKLHKLLVAKLASLEGDPYRKFKLIKYALTRGYDYDSVEKAVAELLG